MSLELVNLEAEIKATISDIEHYRRLCNIEKNAAREHERKANQHNLKVSKLQNELYELRKEVTVLRNR